MDFSKYSGLPVDRFMLRSVTDEIMYEIMRLSGQEYVDTYASTVKTKLLTSAKPKKPESEKDAAKGRDTAKGKDAPKGKGATKAQQDSADRNEPESGSENPSTSA